MKKLTKITFSVFLCLAMLCTAILPSFAVEPKTAFVVVTGMANFPLSVDGKQVFAPTTETILDLAKNTVLPLAKFAANKDYNKFLDAILPITVEAFDGMACNPDGTSKHTVTTNIYPENAGNYRDFFEAETVDEFGVVNAAIQHYGAENTYYFNYDWRLDPLDHADDLNDFIKKVKAETDCDRVALAAFSMGGTITCSYLYKYGSADLDSLILCSTAFQGTSSLSALFTADAELDFYALVRRFAQLTRDDFLDELVMLLDEVLEAYGINDSLTELVSEILEVAGDRVYDECIIPVFGYLPGLWALVDDDEYIAAKENMLANADEKLVERIDEYHYQVQANAQKLLEAAQKDTNVYILAQYNMQGLPVSQTSATTNNDFLIDTKYASGGATCLNLGETLPENYTQAVECGHNHIGVDRQIDASTCMFPEQTWFIRDMGHVDYPVGDSTDFLFWLADSETQLTVHDNAKYPQYLKYDCEDSSLSPVTEDLLEPTTLESVFNVLTKLVWYSAKIFFMIFR